jgi:aspartate-semialdehyde dehydrogenase
MKVAVVGATGLVGTVILKVLEERNFPLTELIPVASDKSIGKEITFRGKAIKVMGMKEAVDLTPDIAIFSAGGNTSREWAPKFAENKTFVIDNSSAWRMDPSKKLIVPEINAAAIKKDDYIIANPNCSTIQLVMVLAPLHKKYSIKRVVVSTYQSVTGSGAKAVEQLNSEKNNSFDKKFYAHQINMNCLPHCDVFTDNGYTKEEIKMVNETQKIIDDKNIKLTATAVRVPVEGGHSESVNIEFERDFALDEIRNLLSQTSGVIVQDDPGKNIYPMPLTSKNKDEVFVGRIRRDFSQDNSLNLWIVSDNLRKGAATNAVQIAEYLVEKNFV